MSTRYRVESDFTYEGYRCVIVLTSMGHRCGYVGIDKTHPLYRLRYNEKIDDLQLDKIKDFEIGKRNPITLYCTNFEDRLSPVQYFDVHGGITYSDGGEQSIYPVESDLWWFGYDCAHWGDAKDINAIKNEQLREIEIQFPNHGVIRTLNYCIDECKSLAKQLKEVELT